MKNNNPTFFKIISLWIDLFFTNPFRCQSNFGLQSTYLDIFHLSPWASLPLVHHQLMLFQSSHVTWKNTHSNNLIYSPFQSKSDTPACTTRFLKQIFILG